MDVKKNPKHNPLCQTYRNVLHSCVVINMYLWVIRCVIAFALLLIIKHASQNIDLNQTTSMLLSVLPCNKPY